MKNALANSFGEDMKIAGVIGDINTLRVNRDLAIKAVQSLEREVRKKPNEWIFWHTLNNLCSPLGWHAIAVRSAEESFRLKPKDPRSSYGLATALRMMIMEINAGKPNFNPIQIPPNIRGYYSMYQNLNPHNGEKELQKINSSADETTKKTVELLSEAVSAEVWKPISLDMDEDKDIPPEKSKEELQELNLAVEKAAKRVIDLFEESISLGLDEANEKITRQSIIMIHTQFPNLGDKY